MKKIHISYFISHISWYQILIILLFAGILLINYFDVLKFKYHVPPGNDPVTHVSITKEILETGKAPVPGYPPGFHYIVAGLSKISSTDPIKTMVYFYPFLMFLSALAVYLFARQFFGQTVGILSLVLFGFLSPQPRQTLWDGGFPNVMGADFLMVLGFLFFLKAYKSEKLKDALLGGLFLGLIPFFHHLSSYLMIALLIPLIISLFIVSAFKKDNLRKKGLILATILFAALLIGGYPAYVYFGKGYLEQISSAFIAYAASWEGFVWRSTSLVSEASPPPWSDYSLVVSPFLWFLGFLALPFVLKGIFKDKRGEYLFIFAWLLVVFILSRPTVFSPLPGRFARELAIPLAICSGIFIKEVLIFFQKFWQKVILVALLTAFLIPGFLGLSSWVGKYNQMVFIRDLDKEAIEWIKENTDKDTKFAVAPYNRWFGLLTDRQFQEVDIDLDKAKESDYLYINRFQEGWMWGDKAPYLQIREEVSKQIKAGAKKRKRQYTFELIKNFGEENERGISIYKIQK